MKTILALLLLLSGAPYDGGSGPFYDSTPSNYVSGSGAITGSDLYCPDAESDIAPPVCVLAAAAAWPRATGANTTGGLLVLSPGMGARYVTISAADVGADSEGDTYSMYYNNEADPLTFTETTYTARNGGAVANEWNCITSAQVCAQNLAALINTNGIPPHTVATALACAATWCVYLDILDPYKFYIRHRITDAGAGAFGAVDASVDGQTLIGIGSTTSYTGSASAPSLAFIGDTNTGIYSLQHDALGVATGGVSRGYWGYSNSLVKSGYMDYSTNGIIGLNGTDDIFFGAGGDMVDLDDMYWRSLAAHTDPAVSVIASQDHYYGVAGAGAPLVLSGGIGSRILTGVTRADTGGDTMSFGITTNGTLTTTVFTEGVAHPNGWTCAGAASDAECVCNLYTLITEHGPTGLQVARTDGTCSDEQLFFYAYKNTTPTATGMTAEGLTVTPSDAASMVVTSGADGGIALASKGVLSAPAIFFANDPDVGIWWYQNNYLGLGPNVLTEGYSQAYQGFVCNSTGGCLSASGSGALVGDIRYIDDWYMGFQTSDVPLAVKVIHGLDAYPQATVNTTGSNMVLAGGIGRRFVTVNDFADSAGDAITFNVYNQGVLTSTTKTEGVASPNGWTCVGTSNAQCACNLYTLLYSGGGVVAGMGVQRTDGTCSDGKVFFYCVGDGTCEGLNITITDSVAHPFGVMTQGADGQVLIGGYPSATAPNLACLYDTDSGLACATNNQPCLVGGGVCSIFATGGGHTSTGGNLLINTTSYLGWSAKAYLSSPAANYAYLYYSTTGGALQHYPQTITCATSGDGNHSTCGGAQTITSNVVQIVCEDADGCTLSLAETNFDATHTMTFTLNGPPANHVDIPDSAGVTETVGGATQTLDALDTIQFNYNPNALAWTQASLMVAN